MYDNPWTYHHKIIEANENDHYAFVYLITNLTNNRKYIGKKLFKNKKTRQIKGKKKKTLVDSDWQEYWGSNTELQEDIQRLGVENFKREILFFCPSKGMANYLELKEQMLRGVLESSEYYNSYVGTRIHKSHVKVPSPPKTA